MNNNANNFYNGNPNFPGTGIYGNNFITPNQENAPTTFDIPFEQSYIENILRLNKGKKIKAYFAFPDSLDWKDSIFNGIVEQAGRDHLILSNPETGKWYLLPMIYMNFIEFDEKINYAI